VHSVERAKSGFELGVAMKTPKEKTMSLVEKLGEKEGMNGQLILPAQHKLDLDIVLSKFDTVSNREGMWDAAC